MSSDIPSVNDFKSYLEIEDSRIRNRKIQGDLIDLRKYGSLEDFLPCEDILVQLLLNYPSNLPVELTLPQVVRTLAAFGSLKAKPILHKMMRYKQPYELRAVVIDSYCYGYEGGTKNKRLLERLFGYVTNIKLHPEVRAASAGAMLYIYYSWNNGEMTRQQNSLAAYLTNYGGKYVENRIPWHEMKNILEGVGSSCYEEFILTDYWQSIKVYENNMV